MKYFNKPELKVVTMCLMLLVPMSTMSQALITNTGNELFIYFGAVNYRAEVYLNGIKLGTHKGGFTPFNFEVTGLVRGFARGCRMAI